MSPDGTDGISAASADASPGDADEAEPLNRPVAHLDGFQTPAKQVHALARRGKVTEPGEQQSGDGRIRPGGILRECDVEIGQIVDRERPVKEQGAVLGDGDGGDVTVELVVDLADELLEDVLQRQDAGPPPCSSTTTARWRRCP